MHCTCPLLPASDVKRNAVHLVKKQFDGEMLEQASVQEIFRRNVTMSTKHASMTHFLAKPCGPVLAGFLKTGGQSRV